MDKIKLRAPVFGTIINKSVIARFTRTLGTLVASGVPILEALNITKDTAGNAVVARAIGHVHDSIREGESIAEPLAQSKICDDMVVNMIDVGEETGDLDKMLLKIADQYDEDVDVAVSRHDATDRADDDRHPRLLRRLHRHLALPAVDQAHEQPRRMR